MDAAKLGFAYTPGAVSGSAGPSRPAATAGDLALNLAPAEPRLQLQRDRLEFINPALSDERPLLTLGIKGSYGFVDQPLEPGSIRSPYLQKQAQELGRELIQRPLEDAWHQGQFDSGAAQALGLGVAGAAAALYSPTPVKSSLGLFRQELGDLSVRSSVGMTFGDGKADFRTAKVSLSPTEQSVNPWHVDLEYRPGDRQMALTYDKSLSRVSQSASNSGAIGSVRASLTHDAVRGSGANFLYVLSY